MGSNKICMYGCQANIATSNSFIYGPATDVNTLMTTIGAISSSIPFDLIESFNVKLN